MNQNPEVNPTLMPEGGLEAEIAWLFSQIEARKEQLAEQGLEKPTPDLNLEKKLIGNILNVETKSVSGDLSRGEDEKRVADLLDLATTKSIKEAMKLAEKEPPYILDRFHDGLIGHLVDKLKQD